MKTKIVLGIKSQMPTIVCCVFLIIFVLLACLSGAWPQSDIASQILSALAGAIVAAVITLFLLQGQTQSEEQRDRRSKIFEEKLDIYRKYLEKLCEIVKDKNITPEEEIEMEFQVADIAMHTNRDTIYAVSEGTFKLLKSIKGNSGGEDHEELLEPLMKIAMAFSEDLYGKKSIDINGDDKTVFDHIINNFRTISIPSENLEQYSTSLNEITIHTLESKDELTDYDKLQIIEARVKNEYSDYQDIWDNRVLYYEFNADIGARGYPIRGYRNKSYVLDVAIDGHLCITIYTREYNSEESKKLADILDTGLEPHPTLPERYRVYYKESVGKEDCKEISEKITEYLKKLKDYRDRLWNEGILGE